MSDALLLGPKDITDGQLEKHQSLRLIKAAHPKEFGEYVKFAVIRHPFDRIYSLFLGYQRTNPDATFEAVIDRLYEGNGDWNIRQFAFFWPLKPWLCDEYGNYLCDEVFRFEDGFGPVLEFLRGLGADINALPHSNSGLGKGRREFYEKAMAGVGDETMEKFSSLYAWDFERFGYETHNSPLAGQKGMGKGI